MQDGRSYLAQRSQDLTIRPLELGKRTSQMPVQFCIPLLGRFIGKSTNVGSVVHWGIVSID